MYIAEIEKKVLNKCIRYVKVDFALALAGSSKVISKKSLNRGNRQTYVDTINEWTIPILTIIQLKCSLRDQHNVYVSILSTRHLILFFGTLVLCGGNQTVTNVVRAAWRRQDYFYTCAIYISRRRVYLFLALPKNCKFSLCKNKANTTRLRPILGNTSQTSFVQRFKIFQKLTIFSSHTYWERYMV